MSASFVLLVCLVHAAEAPKPDLAKAIRLYSFGQYQAAFEVLLKEEQQSPPTAEYYLWLGKSDLKLRKWDDAIRQFERAVLIDPSSSLYHLWLGRALGMKAQHSSFLTAFGPARRVLKEFQTAVRLSPGNVDARFDLLEFYLDAPGILGGGRDHARAEIAQIAGINARLGCTAQARYYEDEKKYDLARQELIQATEKFPSQPRAFVDLADFYFRRRDFADTEAAASKAVAMTTPPERKAQFLLLASWVRLGKNLPQAGEGLLTLSRGPLGDEDPPFADVFYWLGQARLAQGNKVEARQAFETALRFNPDHTLAKTALAGLG